METIAPGVCDAVEAASTCTHTCSAGYYGGSVTCDAGSTGTSTDGTFTVVACGACTSQAGCTTDGATCSTVSGLEAKLICTAAGGADGYYIDAEFTAVPCAAGTYTAAGEDSTTTCDACGSGQYSDGTQACGACTPIEGASDVTCAAADASVPTGAIDGYFFTALAL